MGVDGPARDAGVTSGAFHAHFKSKAEAFTQAVGAGMAGLRQGIDGLRATSGPGWRQGFTDFAMSERATCDATQECALQSLTGAKWRGRNPKPLLFMRRNRKPS